MLITKKSKEFESAKKSRKVRGEEVAAEQRRKDAEMAAKRKAEQAKKKPGRKSAEK